MAPDRESRRALISDSDFDLATAVTVLPANDRRRCPAPLRNPGGYFRSVIWNCVFTSSDVVTSASVNCCQTTALMNVSEI